LRIGGVENIQPLQQKVSEGYEVGELGLPMLVFSPIIKI